MIDKDQNANAQNQINRAYFGVGCWDFGLRCKPSTRFSINQYVALLTKGLESVSSLNNLEIVPELDDQTNTTINSEDGIHADDGMEIFSHGIVWSITFDLYVPFRIQNDLAGAHIQFDTKTENFNVHIRHAYHSPVAFVELVDADEPPAPSSAMVVVREYLRRECQKSSHDLVFSSVGPTPFHANFRIEARAAHNRGGAFELKEASSQGYSDITFFYCAFSFNTARTALNEVINELEDELGVFYKIQRDNSTKYERWDRIEQLKSRLTRYFERMGWRQIIRRALTRGRDLKKLRIALAEFETDQISDEYVTKKAFRNTYRKGASAFLKAYVEAAMEERPVFPTKPTTDLLGFIEGRRLKVLEFLVVLAAAIVGGVTGSFITISVSQ